MFKFCKPTENETIQAAMDYVAKFSPKSTVVVKEKKKNTWLIVLLSVLAVAGIAYLVYKLFFEDDYDDFDDFDDFDDDYDEIFELDDEDLEEPVVVSLDE